MAKKIIRPPEFVDNAKKDGLEKMAAEAPARVIPRERQRLFWRIDQWSDEEIQILCDDIIDFITKTKPRYILAVLQKVGMTVRTIEKLAEASPLVRQILDTAQEVCELNFLERTDQGDIPERFAMAIMHLQSRRQMDHVRWIEENKSQAMREGLSEAPRIQFLAGTQPGGDTIIEKASRKDK